MLASDQRQVSAAESTTAPALAVTAKAAGRASRSITDEYHAGPGTGKARRAVVLAATTGSGRHSGDGVNPGGNRGQLGGDSLRS